LSAARLGQSAKLVGIRRSWWAPWRDLRQKPVVSTIASALAHHYVASLRMWIKYKSNICFIQTTWNAKTPFHSVRSSFFLEDGSTACEGNRVVQPSATNVRAEKNQYTAYPPAQLCSTERENSVVAPAGPRARVKLATVCAKPFVVPRSAGEGQAAVTYIKTQLNPISTIAHPMIMAANTGHTHLATSPFGAADDAAIWCMRGKAANMIQNEQVATAKGAKDGAYPRRRQS